jgi:hypothetical protein
MPVMGVSLALFVVIDWLRWRNALVRAVAPEIR